jgi:hypothetical protein
MGSRHVEAARAARVIGDEEPSGGHRSAGRLLPESGPAVLVAIGSFWSFKAREALHLCSTLDQIAKPRPRPFRLVAFEPSEFDLQCNLVEVLRKFAAADCLWLHIGNGERRDAITGSRLKRRCCPNQRVIRTVVGLNAERVRQSEATY